MTVEDVANGYLMGIGSESMDSFFFLFLFALGVFTGFGYGTSESAKTSTQLRGGETM
jgi:hypothetical protein